MAYLTIEELRPLSPMPDEDIDTVPPVYTLAQLAAYSAEIDSRLSKRYVAPFSAPYPLFVRLWLSKLVTPELYLRRGGNPADPTFVGFKDAAIEARAQMKEAADSAAGLYDLPLRADVATSGIARGGPLSYSEQSPYVAFDEQARVGRIEDEASR